MLMLSVTVAFLLLGVLWLAAVLHEHGLTPMRRMAELTKRPAAEIALVALVAIGMIHHGATKGTNGVNGAGGGLDGGTNGVQMAGGNLSHGAAESTEGDSNLRVSVPPCENGALGDRALPSLNPQPSTLNALPPATNYQLPTWAGSLSAGMRIGSILTEADGASGSGRISWSG